MKNVKGIAVITDGNMKRLVTTYDVIDETGKATSINKKCNRIVTDESVLEAIKITESYAQKIIDEQED